MARMLVAATAVLAIVKAGAPAAIEPVQSAASIDGALAIARLTHAHANVHQNLIGSFVSETIAPPGAGAGPAAPGMRGDRPPLRANVIADSFGANKGILSINQEAGNLNNQANVRLFAVSEGEVQALAFSVTYSRENTLVSAPVERADVIVGSFADTTGIVGVNQSSGSLNQQANLFVLGVARNEDTAPQMALNDGALGELSADNRVLRERPRGRASRSERIADSFGNFRGVAQIAQSAGDANIMRNTLHVSIVGPATP